MGIEREIDIVLLDERWAVGPQNVAAPVGDEQANRSAGEREQSAFCQELAQEASRDLRRERAARSFLFRGVRLARAARLARLAQAISRTRPTAPSIIPPARVN